MNNLNNSKPPSNIYDLLIRWIPSIVTDEREEETDAVSLRVNILHDQVHDESEEDYHLQEHHKLEDFLLKQ